MSENKNESKLEKLLKYEKWINNFFVISAIVALVLLYLCHTKGTENFLVPLFISFAVAAAMIVTMFKISKLVLEEKINQLNDVEFKVIKLKGTEDILLKELLKGSKIEAKFHEDNNDFVIVKISFSNKKQSDVFEKEYIFTVEDIKKILEDVKI